MMKKLKSLSLLLAALMLMSATGCDLGLDRKADLSALDTDAFAIVDREDAIANVEDATLETPMVMNAVFGRDGRFARNPRHPQHRGSHLKQILRQLDINVEQMTKIRDFIKAHRESIKAPLEGLRAANADVIAAANAQRQAILESMRNGEITRDEAKQKLQELNAATREAIRNNPASAPFQQAICASQATLFGNIRSILNSGQQAKWDEWVAGLEGPCSGN